MKKLNYLPLGVLALSMSFMTGCGEDDPKVNVDDLVEDGFYVVGEATAAASLTAEGASKTIMAVGFNEVLQQGPGLSDDDKISSKCQRDGMYEKYIALEGGKPFYLVLKAGKTETKYGASDLALSGTLGADAEEPDIQVYKGTMTENATLQVAENGLYHIVLDLNLKGDLANKLILIAPAELGVRGGMNGWGFTPFTTSSFDKKTITYTLENQELAASGQFKYAYGGGWKIQLDAEGLVKANTNLGKDMKPGASDISVEKGGKYKITLTYTLAQGDISKSFAAKVELTEESTLPTEMYMIGDDFGNWGWEDAGVVALTPVHSHPHAFWTMAYLVADKGFKFCPVKAWNGDFGGSDAFDADGIIAKGGDNIKVATDGIYMIYVDLKANKVEVSPLTAFGIDGAFGGWNEGQYPFTVDIATKTITSPVAVAAADLRMYASCTLSAADAVKVDAWHMEFIILDGKVVFRGNGGDQTRVPIAVGQKAVINVETLTGTIQ
ncbi:hypothetical protein AGMMS4957_20970 [Bacteroidia bacterium]|nr:hypothetical protein AGMMS4957_20970 [Bacteroidia bacterium]